jgi:hypothetical protein
MAYDRRYSTFRVIHSVLPLGDVREFFAEGDDSPLPDEVVTFVRLLKKLGRFESGWTITVRYDSLDWACQLIDRHETVHTDVRSGSGTYAVYLF